MEVKSYILGNTQIDYLIDEKGYMSMQIFPKEETENREKPWEIKESTFNPRVRYIHKWETGSIAYYHLVGENSSFPGNTMKVLNTASFVSQEIVEDKNSIKIKTLLATANHCKILHTITYMEGLEGFECETEFVNESGAEVTIDMLSSFALDNLSPFHKDDAPNSYNFHRFFGGWSMEGKHICQSIEELSLEKSWAGFNGNNEKFGSKGSYPVKRYFPTAVFEDKTAGVMWAAQLAHNATWQMELTRMGNSLSFTGGLGDREFCGWKKTVKNGESFKAPKAFIAAVKGDVYDACHAVCDMQRTAQEAYGEEGIPTIFNEYCATWGKPTQEKMLAYCQAAKKYGIKYLVIDAGWCKAGCEQDGNGEWNIDKTIFPDVKSMNRTIRENGMIPGVWFEFEVTTKGSKMFEPEYDFMKLKKDGYVLKSGDIRSYWDFRREDVREYLYEKVIKMLKDNGFGYIKVDYNNNIGVEVDGAESGAEGLREHLACVYEFFAQMKKEIPDLIVENCASGGHRLEPSMMGVTAVSSFSDAHEAVEIPYIAASLHNLMLPSQELIWAVLHEDDSRERLVYSLAATFLGRVCLSGPIDKLEKWQEDIVMEAMNFYQKLENVIKNGKTKIYGNRNKCMRYPTGVQVVVRSTENEILVVCHSFESDMQTIEFAIPEGFIIKEGFNSEHVILRENKIIISDMEPFNAGAVLLNKCDAKYMDT